jgi:hypothetical protein
MPLPSHVRLTLSRKASASTLDSGDLVSGGTVTGDIYFEAGAETGDFFVIYKPEPFDAALGVWRSPFLNVTVRGGGRPSVGARRQTLAT